MNTKLIQLHTAFQITTDMRKVFLLSLFAAFFVQAQAQQDPMFTKYMFNSLAFNPAYAGSKGHMAISALHRNQWYGIDGAPSTQSFTLHTPLQNDRVGVGFSLLADKIGPTNTLGANLSYAYRIPVGKRGGSLSIGLQAGMYNWTADWTQLNLQDPNDNAFAEIQPNRWLPNFGVGLYYSTKHFYIGVASPHLVEYDLRDAENIETEIYAKQYRHYFGMMGAAIPLKGNALIFKPSILIKNVGLLSNFHKEQAFKSIGAPTEFDIDLSLLIYETFWIGTSFRTALEYFSDKSSFDSVDIWASYYLKNGLRVGLSYDYTLTKLRQPAEGTFEVMLGYEFNYQTKRTVGIILVIYQ